MVVLRDKSRNEVVHVVIKFLKTEYQILCIQTKVQVFKSHLIRYFVAQNEVKADYAEIAIKSMKNLQVLYI